jgi:hypothetical protein
MADQQVNDYFNLLYVYAFDWFYMYVSDMSQQMLEGILQIGFIKRALLSFFYKDQLASLKQVLEKDCVKMHANNIDTKDPFEWSVQDFRRVKFATHPDKCGNANDFSTIVKFQT